MSKNQKQEKEYFQFDLQPGKIKADRLSSYVGEVYISIITYYTGKSEINQTYISLLNQTFPHWEWIIVANKKDENIKKLKAFDKRIKIIIVEEKQIAKVQYIAVKQAKADIILLLDQEDIIDKTMLECGYFTMITNPEGMWAYSNMVTFGDYKGLYNKKLSIYEVLKQNIISKCAFIRKEKFIETEKDIKLPIQMHEDWYMWLYFFSKDYVPIKMDYYGYWHRKKKDKEHNVKKYTKEQLQMSHKYIENMKEEINLDARTIQFDKIYQIDYKDTPKKIEITKKNIFLDNSHKKILFIFPWFLIGGSEIFAFNLIKGLREKGYEISVITTKKCEYILRQQVEQYVDEYFDLTTFLKEKDWASFIYHIIKSRKIDCVFITNSFYGYYALPWLKHHFPNIPFVDYIHAENWTLRNGGFPKDSNSVANYLDMTFTCTKHLKEMMYKIMNRNIKNIKFVYIGTDVDFYNNSVIYDKEEELKEKYKGKKVILFISRIVHYKRPLFAIKLMQEIIKERQDIKLVIVGDGQAIPDTKQKVEELHLEDYVDFYGVQEDVRRFYKIADVTLVCSLREGLTLTTYESLSMGVPVVSSDIGGQKELIGTDCGYLIRPYQLPEEQFDFNYSQEEIEEYKQAIYKILDNPSYIDYNYICRDKVVKHFSIKNMINDIDKHITKLIKTGSTVDKNLCKNIEFAERYLLVNSMLETLTKVIEKNNNKSKK